MRCLKNLIYKHVLGNKHTSSSYVFPNVEGNYKRERDKKGEKGICIYKGRDLGSKLDGICIKPHEMRF